MKRTLASILFGCFILAFCNVGISADTKYVGSKNYNRYHYTWCKRAQSIKPADLITFKSPEEAIAARYLPCKICRPPTKSK